MAFFVFAKVGKDRLSSYVKRFEINSKDKNTYLKLLVNQVRKRSSKKTFRALEQLHIYLHQGIK